MSSSVTLRLWQQALEALARRNATVEVSPTDENQAQAPVDFQCRLLHVEPDGSLLIELPATSDGQQPLVVGAGIRMVVSHQGQRWESLRSVVGRETFALNDTVTTRAARLGPASEVKSGQRRQFYRADLGVLGEVRISLLPAAGAGGAAAPWVFDLASLDLATVNLSGGGVGVRVAAPPETIAQLLRGRSYRCGLTLPGLPNPVELAAELVHVEPMPDEAYYLGLAFQFDDDAARQQVQDQIARFTTQVQRQQIRRQRRG